jgi:hypothetical protein
MPPPTPPRRDITHFPRGEPASAIRRCDLYSRDLLAGGGGGRAGWFAKRCHLLTDHRIDCKFKTKIANTILLLCYFDKICLSPTGGLWQASANLYSEEKLYIKGSRSLQLALSRLHCILQSTPLWKKEVGHSNTHGTVGQPLFFSCWNTAAHSLHFQHLMWTKGYRFKTSTVKRSLVSIVHINI